MNVEKVWTDGNAKITDFILRILGTKECGNEVMTQKVRYTVQVLLGETEKMLLLVVMFVIFHRLAEFVIAFLTLGLLRIFVGGTHRKTMTGCFLFSFISFSLIVMAAERIVMSHVWRYIVYGTAILLIRLCTPVPSSQRIAYNREQRVVLQCRALTVLSLLVVIGRIVPDHMENLIVWAILFQVLELIWCMGCKWRSERNAAASDSCQ